MKVELFPLADMPWSLKGLFDSNPWPEGSWEWFSTLADTTLAPNETAIVGALSDPAGSTSAMLPLIRGTNGNLRGLAAPYTTRFSPQLGDETSANLLGRSIRRFVTNIIRIDAL